MEAWVITGFKWDVYDSASKELKASNVSFAYPGAQNTVIMHGRTFLPDNSVGYGYLTAAWRKHTDYLADPAQNKQAVVGGFIYKSNSTSTTPKEKEDEWGANPGRDAAEVALFYGDSGQSTKRACVWFDRAGVAPITQFWRNDQIAFGPNLAAEKLGWGTNIGSYPDAGRYALTLAKVKAIRIIDQSFPDLGNSFRSSDRRALYSKRVVNQTSRDVSQTIEVAFAQDVTASLSFTQGKELEISTGFELTLPLLGKANTTVTGKFKFESLQQKGTSESYAYKDTVTVPIPPKTYCIVEGLCSCASLTVYGTVVTEVEYCNGARQNITLPVMLTSTNAFDGSTRIRDRTLPARMLVRNPDDDIKHIP